MLPEATVQEHVIQLLRAFARPDVLWFAVPNGEYRHVLTGAKLKRQGVRAGAADLIFLIDGGFHAVELKTDKGNLSVNQIAFRLDVERAGGHYYICHGLIEAFETLQDIKALKPGVRITFPDYAPQPISARPPASRRRPPRV